MNEASPPSIVKSSKPYEKGLLGIISTKPAVNLTGQTANGKPVALSGRVPVKVSTENGPINIGDYLTSSTIAGVAMKAIRAGPVVGKALENYDQVDPTIIGRVLTFVNVSYADPGNFLAGLSLDADGNLIMPKIKVGSIIVNPVLATASATLTDPSITPTYNLGDKLAAIEKKQATDSARIASASADIAETKVQTNSLAQQLASAAAEIAQTKSKVDSLNLTPPDTLLATGSAQLATLTVESEATVSGMLNAYQAGIQDNFKVFGTTTLGKTNIAGDLNIDGTLSIENGNTINAISILHLQSSILAEGLDMFNGKVTIDKDGNIKTSGEVAGASIVTNKLTISNTPVASSSATLTPTIGSGKILAGQTSIVINTAQVTSTSKIFVTPRTKIGTQSLVVDSVTGGLGFSVSLDHFLADDVTFDWWIVESK